MVSIFSAILLGILSSIVATLITNFCLAYRTRKRYDAAIGEYIGYGFEDDNANPLVQKQTPLSKATVTHLKENILRIEVEHGDRKWNGDVAMEHETSGTMVWQYIDLPENEHSFGYKRMLVREATDGVYLYLLGELPFGKEVFIRQK